MPCFVGKNTIVCFKSPNGAKSRLKHVKSGVIFWAWIKKEAFSKLDPDSAVEVFEDDNSQVRRFKRSFLEFVETDVEHYSNQMATAGILG